MLAATFYFDGASIVLFAVGGGAAALLVLLGTILHVRPGDWRYLIGSAALCLVAGTGIGLWAAHDEAVNQRGNHVAMYQLTKLEHFKVSSLDFQGQLVTIKLASSGCLPTFSLAMAYGHDSDGYKLRWRPAIQLNQSDSWIGLGSRDLKFLQLACSRS